MGVAQAGPSFRYCEAGYVNLSTSESTSFSDGLTSASFEVDDTSGASLACKFELLSGFFVHGEYQQASADWEAIFDGDIEETFRDDLTAKRLRFGAGLALDVPFLPFTAYGQVSYTNDTGDFEIEGEEFDLDADGFDLEVGGRGVVSDRFDLGAYIRYADAGSISTTDSLGDLESDGEVALGLQGAVKVVGPLWATARFQAAEVNEVFVGARVGF